MISSKLFKIIISTLPIFPWTARRSNQSILKEICPEYSLEGLMLKLKLQYFGHLMWRADSFEKTVMLAKIEGKRKGDNRGWDGWMASLTQWTWIWVSSGSWWWTGRPGVLQSMGSQRVGQDWVTKLNWTELIASVGSLGNDCRLQASSRQRQGLFCPLNFHDLALGSPSTYKSSLTDYAQMIILLIL